MSFVMNMNLKRSDVNAFNNNNSKFFLRLLRKKSAKATEGDKYEQKKEKNNYVEAHILK